MARYQRQMLLPQIGIKGQKKLSEAKVLCVGAGGLGSPVLMYLASAGVGHIGIVDPDEVALSNLQRQILFESDQVGEKKASKAQARLTALNPTIHVQAFVERLEPSNAIQRMRSYDVVVDCTDNFKSTYLINEVAAALEIPMVFAALSGCMGQISVFWNPLGPCYRCLFDQPPQEPVLTCEQSGILGATAGIVGAIQGLEVIKSVLHPDVTRKDFMPLVGQVLCVDTATMQLRKVPFAQRPSCPVCTAQGASSKHQRCPPLKEYVPPKSINYQQGNQLGVIWVDVRESEAFKAGHLEGALHLPLSTLEIRATDMWAHMPKDQPLGVYCQSGQRSQLAVQLFQEAGFTQVFNLHQGWLGISAH